MANVKFYKVTALPVTPEADSFYFVQNGGYAESYITNSSGVAKMVGNTQMITEVIATQFATLNRIEIAATIAARNTNFGQGDRNEIVLVLDATGDPTVTAGAALYVFRNSDDSWIKVAEYESLSENLSLSWSAIVGGPTSSPAQIDDAVSRAHDHANKTVLDALSAPGGVLNYNGAPVGVTDLSFTTDLDSVQILSSAGADVDIPAATASDAGVMSATDKAKLDSFPDALAYAKHTTVRVITDANIDIATALVTGQVIQGVTLAANDRVLVVKQTTIADNGIYVVGATPARDPLFGTVAAHAGYLVNATDGFSKDKAVALNLNTLGTTVTATYVGITDYNANTDATTAFIRGIRAPGESFVNLTSIPSATGTNAGVLSAADKTKLDGIEAGAQVNVAADLSFSGTATDVTVASSTGTDATIPGATTSTAGVLTAADKSKLDGIEAGAQANVPTNLTVSETATSVTVLSSTGTDATIAEATQSVAGVLSAADKSKLDSIAVGASATKEVFVNYATNTSFGAFPESSLIAGAIIDFGFELVAGMTVFVHSSGNFSRNGIFEIQPTGDAVRLAGYGSSAAFEKLHIFARLSKGVSNTLAYADGCEYWTLDGGNSIETFTVGVEQFLFQPQGNDVYVFTSSGESIFIPAATQTEAGAFSPVDKTKLDGVEVGATRTVWLSLDW